MARSLKALFFAEIILNFLKFPGVKLYDVPALGAEHVVVVFMAERAFIDCAVFGLPYLFDESAFTEEVQGPVNRSPRSLRAPPSLFAGKAIQDQNARCTTMPSAG